MAMANNPEKSSPPAKRAKKEKENQNPLTHYLPEDVLDIALTLLPLKEAAMVSTVATRFRRSWCFNKKFLFGRELSIKNDQRALVTLVDRLFDSHRGDEIQCFHLHVDPIGVEALILKWLKICSEKNTEDIQINFLKSGFTLIPFVIESLKNLRILKLVHCGLAMPPVARSMPFLHTVVLRGMEITTTQFELLLFNCRALEVLELFRCSKIHRVRLLAREHHRHLRVVKISRCVDVDWVYIDSPTLCLFWYSGIQPSVDFGGNGVLALQDAIFNFSPRRGRGGYTEHHQLEDMVNVLHHVTTLTISAYFLESLSARIRREWVYQVADFRLSLLKELQLFMEATSYCSPLDILLFLKNCPNLERLFIDINKFNFGSGMLWEVHQKPMLNEFNHYFNELRTVKIKGFKFERSELVLVKFLLQRSKFLERLIFITAKNGSKLKLPDAPKYNNLFHSWKASPNVNILLYANNGADKSGIHPTHPKNWR